MSQILEVEKGSKFKRFTNHCGIGLDFQQDVGYWFVDLDNWQCLPPRQRLEESLVSGTEKGRPKVLDRLNWYNYEYFGMIIDSPINILVFKKKKKRDSQEVIADGQLTIQISSSEGRKPEVEETIGNCPVEAMGPDESF